ncbi:MAG: hypothetical protein P8Y45_02355 [Exilibacterium sp.]
MKYIISMLFMLLFSTQSSANYDANFKGKILSVLTYPHSKIILIRVEGQPTTHPVCSKFDYLAIDPNIDHETRQIVFARLLMAYATGETVNIGYDANDECIGARMKVYRVG